MAVSISVIIETVQEGQFVSIPHNHRERRYMENDSRSYDLTDSDSDAVGSILKVDRK